MEIFNPFFEAIAKLLALFYDIYPSLGFAIIGLTLVVMIVLTPLTLKGTRSMMMLQQLQPELKKLQSKYADDRQQLNEEMMKFYRENNINPVGGCLPLLLQMPVFFFLYNVLKGISLRVPLVAVGWASGQGATGQTPTVAPKVYFDPAHLSPDSSLYQFLHTTTTIPFFSMDLSESCSEALSQHGVIYAIPYMLLIVIVGVSGFVQQRQIQGRNAGNTTISPQQQQIMKFMPIILPVFSFALPSGLVLYFAVSNLYRIGMQAFISRSIYGIKRGDNKDAGGNGDSKGGKPSPKGTGGKGSTGGSGRGGNNGSNGSGPKGKGPNNAGGGTAARSTSKGGNAKVPAKANANAKTTGTGSASKARDNVAANSKASGSAAKSAGTKSGDTPAKTTKAAPATSKAGKPAGRTQTPTSDAGKTPALQPRARKNKKR